MAQAASPGDPELPCSPKQALALYQLLFQRPARLGQLQAALRQVQLGEDCPLGLALPTVLLEMERSRRAQEQLLWDLELLTGAGLGLFWPSWTRFWYQRHQAQHTRSQYSQPLGRMGGNSEQQRPPEMHLRQPLDSCRGQAPSWSPVSDLHEARRDIDPRQEGSGTPEKATSGCLQEMNPTTSRCFEEPGNSVFKDLVQREQKSQAEAMIQGSATPRSPEGRKLNQEAPGPSSLASQGLLAPQYPTKGLGLGLEGERAEPQKLLLLLDSPQCLGEAVPGGEGAEAAQRENKVVPPSQGEKSPQSQREEAPQGESTEGPQTGNSPMCLQERDPQGQDMKTWKSWEGYITPAWEVAQRAATAQLLEEGSPLGQWRDIPMSVGEQSPPSLERGNPGPRGRATQGKWDKTEGKCHELAVPTLGAPREEAWAPLQGLGAGMPATRGTVSAGRPELPLAVPVPGGSSGPAHRTVGEASFPGALGERRGGSGGLPTSKAAWPAPPGLSPEQQESALQRLLELHGAARRRRWRDREQQRLRVLERLRIAGNRHCRVHPLGLPSGPAHLQTQEDAAEWRRALRERLDQVYQERTGRLRTLGARNTHNFQELLWTPDAEDPVPGE